jgi:hypothetical protein
LKAPGILVGAAVALAGISHGRARRALGGLAVGVAVAIVVGAPAALRSVADVGRHGHYQPQYSLQALAVLAAHGLGPAHAATIGIALALLLCAAVAVAAVVAWRAPEPGTALCYLAIAAWLALPNPYPWYALWVLPVAVLALDHAAGLALWAATISIVIRYLPDAFGSPTPDQQAVIAALELVPLLYALRSLLAPAAAEEPAV